MTIPTSTELDLLKSRPHRSIGWLSIYSPQIALQARVNDVSIAKGARSITYDTVTAGSYSLVEANFLLLVGTTLGGSEKGTIRVKSATSSVLTVAENSHINWADDDYLTVQRYIRIEPIFTRIIQNPADEMDVIFYKDYDVAYTNQNTVLGAFVNAGCHFAGNLDEGGNCLVYYSASGTSHMVAGTTLSYNWWFQGATTTGSSNHTPGYINYTAPGNYVTRLLVSGSNGSVDTTYRFIRIYDHPSRGTDKPIAAGKWSTTDISGSRGSGGYKTTFRIQDDIDLSLIQDNALVVIYTDDYYNNVHQSIGGNCLNRSQIKFVGYIVAGTIEYDSVQKYVEFDAESVTGIMQRCESFSVSVESKTSPAAWFELLNMDCRRAIYHYLRWHSTVLFTTDVEFSGTDQNIQYFDADRTSLYDAVENLMDGTLNGSVVADRQGKIWCEINYDAYSNGGSLSIGPVLDKHDIMGKPLIDRRESEEVSYLEMGGIKYDGPAVGTFSALLCATPGSAPAYRGKVERVQGLALASQAQLNTLAGNIFAHRNAKYPSVDLKFAGNYNIYDIAPQELVPLNIGASDTPLGIVWSGKKFVPISCTLQFDVSKRWLGTSIDVAEICSGVDADTIIIPDAPPTETPDSGGNADVPPLTVPPIPTAATPSTAASTGTVPTAYAAHLYGAVVSSSLITSYTVEWDNEYYDPYNFRDNGTDKFFTIKHGSGTYVYYMEFDWEYETTWDNTLDEKALPEYAKSDASFQKNTTYLKVNHDSSYARVVYDSIPVTPVWRGTSYGHWATIFSANTNDVIKITLDGQVESHVGAWTAYFLNNTFQYEVKIFRIGLP